MSATISSKLGLTVPTPGTGELVSLANHINGNQGKLEAAIGAGTCTSATRPSSPFAGQFIRESDTGRLYVHNGSTPASAGWLQVTAQGSSVGGTGGGATAMQRMYLTSGTASANRAIATRGSSDTQDHWEIDYDGAMQWGTGSAALDTNLYRSAADTLKTDDAFVVGGNLSVSGIGKKMYTELTSDQVLSSTTMVNTVLSFAVVAGGIYRFSADLYHKMTADGDINIGFTFPAGRLSWGGYLANFATPGTTSLATAEFRNKQGQTTSPSGALTAGSLTDGNGAFSEVFGSYHCTTAGTVTMTVALRAASGTTSLLTDSCLLAERVA